MNSTWFLWDVCLDRKKPGYVDLFTTHVLESATNSTMRHRIVNFPFKPQEAFADYSPKVAFFLQHGIFGPSWVTGLEKGQVVLHSSPSPKLPSLEQLLRTLVYGYTIGPSCSSTVAYPRWLLDPEHAAVSKGAEFGILCWVRSTVDAVEPDSVAPPISSNFQWLTLEIDSCAITDRRYRQTPDAALWLFRNSFFDVSFWQKHFFPFLRTWCQISFYIAHLSGCGWSFACNESSDPRNEVLLSHHLMRLQIPLVKWNVEKRKKPDEEAPVVRGGAKLPYIPLLTSSEQRVWVLDFTGFYPNIIVSHQPTPHLPPEHASKFTPTQWTQRMEDFFPTLLQTILQQRAQTPKDTPLSTALKLVANSIYGCTGSSYFRFYCPEFTIEVESLGRARFAAFVALLREGLSFPAQLVGGSTDSVLLLTNADITRDDFQTAIQEWNLELQLDIPSQPFVRTCILKTDSYLAFQTKWIFKGVPQVSAFLPMPVRELFTQASKLILSASNAAHALQLVAEFFLSQQLVWRKQWLGQPLSNLGDWIFWTTAKKKEGQVGAFKDTLQNLMNCKFLPTSSNFSFSIPSEMIKHEDKHYPLLAVRDLPHAAQTTSSSTPTSNLFTLSTTSALPPTMLYPAFVVLRHLQKNVCLDLLFYWKHFVEPRASNLLSTLWKITKKDEYFCYTEKKYYCWYQKEELCGLEDSCSFAREIFHQLNM